MGDSRTVGRLRQPAAKSALTLTPSHGRCGIGYVGSQAQPDHRVGVRQRSGARAPQRGANRAQDYLEHGTGDAHVVVQIGTQASRNGEHPLAGRHMRQHVVREAGSDLAHAPGVA